MSSLISNALPFALGNLTTNTAYAPLLGRLYYHLGNVYRLCQAGAAISTPQFVTVASTIVAGLDSFIVNLTAVASGDPEVIGIIPSDYGTTTIPINSFFFVQVAGMTNALAQSSSTIVAGTSLVAWSVSGQVAINTVSLLGGVQIPALFAVSLGTPTSAAGSTVPVRLSKAF